MYLFLCFPLYIYPWEKFLKVDLLGSKGILKIFYIFIKFAKLPFRNVVQLILLMANESAHLRMTLAALETMNSSRKCSGFSDLYSPLHGTGVDWLSPATVSKGRYDLCVVVKTHAYRDVFLVPLFWS